MKMNWQQKAAALESLAEINIRCRGAGDWYVSQHVEIKGDGVLIGEYGNGVTPQEAIEEHWKKLVEEIGDRWLIANAGRPERRAVRWNGFMWADVQDVRAKQLCTTGTGETSP